MLLSWRGSICRRWSQEAASTGHTEFVLCDMLERDVMRFEDNTEMLLGQYGNVR
jgi:hypothetical protein